MTDTARPTLPDTRLHRRVRASMYLAFAVLAALALFQAVAANRFERARAEDAELVGTVGMERALTAELGRLAALAGAADPAPAAKLAAALHRARTGAAQVDAIVGRRLETAAAPPVAAALAGWQQARERLWRRCDALIAGADGAEAAVQ